MNARAVCGLVVALGLSMLVNPAAAGVIAPSRSLLQTTTTALGLGTNVQKLENSTLSALQTIAPNVANLFSNSLALTSPITSSSGTSYITGVAGNLQKLVGQQSTYYQNLQAALKSNNGTFAQRTVCDLGALYQAIPSLFTTSTSSTGSNALSKLLTDSSYAKLFNQECQNVDPSYGGLAPTVAGLLGNNTIAQQVQALIAKVPSTTTTTTTSTIPAYLKNTALGNYLTAIQAAGKTTSSSTQGLGAKLVTNYFEGLGSSIGSTTSTAAPTASAASTLTKLFQSVTGGK